MVYAEAEQMANVGFVVARDGVVMTGTGDEGGFVRRVGSEWEPYTPNEADFSATDWSVLG